MRCFLFWLVLCLALGGCMRRVLREPPRTMRAERVLARCRLDQGVASCSFAGRTHTPVRLEFAVHSAVPRLSGGMWLLGTQGELARLSPAGALSGLFDSTFTALASTRDLVCGSTGDGRVLCARDFREDSSGTCPTSELGPWFGLPLKGPLGPSDPRARRLCTQAGTPGGCLEVAPTCDAICLSFPACSQVRCVDPCGPGEAHSALAVKRVPAAAVFVSSRGTGAGT
jgi:hypothetical protein